MGTAINSKDIIMKDIEELTPELIQEVVDFIEFLKYKRVKRTGVDYNSLIIQQKSLSRIWDVESENTYEL
jgi:hypothetical protein